jgi:hypothetical protein
VLNAAVQRTSLRQSIEYQMKKPRHLSSQHSCGLPGGFAQDKFWWTNFVTMHSHQIFPGRLENPTKFFRHEICPAKKKIFGAFGAIPFVSYVFIYGLRKKTTKNFVSQNLSREKF